MRKLTDSWGLVQACCETSSMLQEPICAPPSSRKLDPILHLSNLMAKRYVFRDKCGELQMALRVNQMATLMPFFFFNYHAEMKPRQIWKTSVISICYREKKKVIRATAGNGGMVCSCSFAAFSPYQSETHRRSAFSPMALTWWQVTSSAVAIWTGENENILYQQEKNENTQY